MSKSYGNSILLSDEAPAVEQKIKNSVTDRPKLTDRGSPDRCPVGNLHQIFSDKERLSHITQGCTQATITCVECKALAVESVNAHLAPIRERRHALAQNPAKLRQTIQHGAQKAIAAAKETMSAVRDAIGLLRLGAVESLAAKEETTALRVPESIVLAKDAQEKDEILTTTWLERVSKNYPLRKDRPSVFITRKGRKVGIYGPSRINNREEWDFVLKDQPLNVLVLLAHDDDTHYLRDYVLPPKFLQEYWNQFERTTDQKSPRVLVYIRKIEGVVSLVLTNPLRAIPIEHYEGQKHEANYSELN
jgi:hypothetical protein